MSQDPSESANPTPDVLASDAEREQIVGRLNTAVAEGRLTLSEFSDRSAAVYAARTRAELTEFVADLPQPAPTSASQLATTAAGNLAASGTDTGVPPAEGEQLSIGAIKRSGRWRLPVQSDMYVALGSIKLDLRDAELDAGEVTLRARTGIGTIKVVVPEHIRVIVDGGTQLGTRTIGENHIPSNVAAPTVRLRLDTGVGTVKVFVAKNKDWVRHRRYW